MQLRISFCKPIDLKKDMFRFAPVWALYLIGMLLFLMGNGYYGFYDRFAYYVLTNMIPAFGIVNLCYASLCAVALFGDLYNTKLCYSLHAMPYRRESWLTTHLLAGLSFSLVPNAIAAVYLMWRLQAYWFLGLYWLLAVTLQFLFFYGIATVSAMLTGNRFAALLVCAGFNFVSLLLYATIQLLYLPWVTGLVVNLSGFSRFSPVSHLYGFDFFQFTREKRQVTQNYETYYDAFFRYDGLGDGWGYLVIIGLVGLAAMALSVWLYRKRHLESAGDFVAFPKLKGLACVIMTLCATLCCALIGQLFSHTLIWMTVGLIVGYFGSLMLLERRLKVFRKRTFLGFTALVVTVVLSLCAVGFDWLGIESWTPKADRVASVTVSNSRVRTNITPMGDILYSNNLQATVENEADIARVIEAHQDILDRLDEMGKAHITTHRVTLVYKMKSGRTVVRSYNAPASGKNYDIIRAYLYQADSVLGFTDPAKAAQNMEYISCDMGQIPSGMYETVLDALQADCRSGFVLMDSKADYYLEYCINDPATGEQTYRYLGIQVGAERLLSVLKSPEIAMGYTDWDDFWQNIDKLVVNVGNAQLEVPLEQREELLMAIRKDIEAGNITPGQYISGTTTVYYGCRNEEGIYESREFYLTKTAKYTNNWLKRNGYTPTG